MADQTSVQSCMPGLLTTTWTQHSGCAVQGVVRVSVLSCTAVIHVTVTRLGHSAESFCVVLQPPSSVANHFVLSSHTTPQVLELFSACCSCFLITWILHCALSSACSLLLLLLCFVNVFESFVSRLLRLVGRPSCPVRPSSNLETGLQILDARVFARRHLAMIRTELRGYAVCGAGRWVLVQG